MRRLHPGQATCAAARPDLSGDLAVAGHRREFDRQLDAIDARVIELFAIVCEDLPEVTQALLAGSNDGAGQLAKREQGIDSLYREIELLASREILLQAPVASDLRFLLTVLRVAPELVRSHDLAGQIASRAGHSLMQMTLVARFYQRLADHAVNIARRTTYLAGSPTQRATGIEPA